MIEAASQEPALSLSRVIFKHHGRTMLVAFFCKFLYDWIQFIGPLIQRLLMELVSSRTDERVPGTQAAPAWQGYFLTAILFITQIIMSFLFEQMFYISLEVGLRVRASIVSVLYKKALRLSSQAKEETTTGEIVNLMAVDGQRMQDLFMYVNAWVLWSAPLTIAISLWQLYLSIGPSAFLGFGLMAIAVPANGLIAIRQKTIQSKQMKLKDMRVKIMNEALSGIKVIKLYAWEPSFEEKVSAIRREEIKSISDYWKCLIVQYVIISATLTLVPTATFTIYVLVDPNHMLTPTAAFLTLTLFRLLRGPLFQLPKGLSTAAMASVSINRIVNFFKTSDLSDKNIEKDDSCDVSLRITDATFSWCPDSINVLSNINFEVPTGSLTAVVGQVGSGKSSLLAACVGDMHKHSGRVVLKGSVALVAQHPWIQNATVRDNITFGKPFDQRKYDDIVTAVALASDFKILDHGDQTLIGEKGINLSGGQKQRVSLARACYSESDLYLFDDPLSAVDAHVGRHIFEHVIGPNGLLKEKTRVLVTHGLQWLPEVDSISVLTEGRITETGTYQELIAEKGALAALLEEHTSFGASESAATDERYAASKKNQVNSPGSEFAGVSQRSGACANGISPKANQESVESGKVTTDVYKVYAKSMGYFWLTATFLFMLASAATNVGSSIWLSEWTDNERFLPATKTKFSDEAKWSATSFYLVIYWVITLLRTLMLTLLTYSFAKCSISASTYLHDMLLARVMKAHITFFDTKPLGQILNRFSRDIDSVDNVLGNTALLTWLGVAAVLAAVIVVMYGTPVFAALIIPLVIWYYVVQRYFIRALRQLKRWEAVTRSPIYTHFSETITGAQTIRAFGVQERFIQKSEDLVEENNLFFYAGWTANRWLGIQLQLLSGLAITFVAAFCILSTQIPFLQQHINSSIVGLTLSYALLSTNTISALTKTLTDLETNVVSIERIKEYSEVPLEAERTSDTPAPRQWPSQGAIQFKHYATSYRPELNPVLQGLDFVIKPQEKVGIVGRTGAGKSSLSVALFRLIEARKGSIYIDGVDIETIGLHQLRNKLTILPQDPVLFSGTIRDNLDPLHRYSDYKIWEVLEQSYLKEHIENQPEMLEYNCGDNGQNFSVGQRQLVCLARALLRKTKILVLDEATAAVDLETDDLIQKTIRTAFADCTILTIAHRLNTIMDSDRILVLNKGMVAEFDTPENLLKDEEGIFSSMVREAGLKAK
ncbi:multidrug resistance-associated protein 1-like [Watersipora subatra]|uniref:multidrug resistance-associated protein 1-like n=1 Tax=Watersipora subatra TaxID=2589382 RepID=UPI00355BD833